MLSVDHWLASFFACNSRAVLATFVAALALLATSAGCNRSPQDSAASAAVTDRAAVKVTVVKPARTTLRLSVPAPGRIEAFERTPIYPKIAGYVQDYVDIGDEVKEGQVLAELYVPELVKELELKDQLVKQAQEAFEVAKARVQLAVAHVKEAQAGVQRAEANHKSRELEYARISKLAAFDEQTRDEVWYQWQSAKAGWKETEAKVETAQAAVRESDAKRNNAQVDIAVAKAEYDRVAALLSYSRLTAPFNGIVTRRNFNKGDLVQPPTAGKGEPLFVVERRDKMRVFVEIPESDATWVGKGAKAVIRIPALQGKEFAGEVTRTSYSLDSTTRTLLAEIDLPNPQDQLRSNMYAFVIITAERANILAVPATAVVTQGEITSGFQTFCFLIRDGKAVRLRVQAGRSDQKHTEVVHKQTSDGSWEGFTGNEEVIVKPPPNLADGQPVEIAK